MAAVFSMVETHRINVKRKSTEARAFSGDTIRLYADLYGRAGGDRIYPRWALRLGFLIRGFSARRFERGRLGKYGTNRHIPR